MVEVQVFDTVGKGLMQLASSAASPVTYCCCIVCSCSCDCSSCSEA